MPANPWLSANNTLFLNGLNNGPQLINSFLNKKSNAVVFDDQATIPTTTLSTNINLNTVLRGGIGISSQLAGGVIGVPQLGQSVDSVLDLAFNSTDTPYSTLSIDQLKSVPGVPLADFRNRRSLNANLQVTKNRLDGTSAAFRGGSIAFAAAAASPIGAYTIFGLDTPGRFGYGFGSQDALSAIRNDFTARSHVTTTWDTETSTWQKTKNILEKSIPFRGDRVNVIDYSKRTLDQAYRWNSTEVGKNGIKSVNDYLSDTSDLIKFYFTGPSLSNNSTGKDDIIVFRAIIGSITDSYNPSWTPVPMIGRADPNYHFTQVTRTIGLDFTVYASDRDEMKPIWRKLNALAGYTAPEYDRNNIAFRAPWLRFTLGDLFRQQPAFINSLSYTMQDADTTWEINIERDPTMMQAPQRIDVSLDLTIVTDVLPEKGGRFYTLTSGNNFDETGLPTLGNHNWLSDVKQHSNGQTENLNTSADSTPDIVETLPL
jgi:hypothetical protein